MSWTKRQLVTQAYEEIGYASYAYDLEVEQLQAAMRRLDAMMATWNSRGVNVGYPLPDSPQNSELDEETQIPDWCAEAIYMNLAIRIAPTVGKGLSIETKAAALASYNEVLRRITQPREMKFPTTTPYGSGNKPWREDETFIRPADDGVILPPDNEVEFDG